jgi:3-hydroxyacyl-CoA dehydrogenase
MTQVAVIGAGLIGRAWSVVFARAGFGVALYDADPSGVSRCLEGIDVALRELHAAGLVEEAPAVVRARVRPATTLAGVLEGASYVQENISENLASKQALYAQLDRLAAPDAVLASSTSGIPASQWSRDVAGRDRCLVAHPVNPPHLVPIVELSPAPWTRPDVVARAKALQESAGQVPVVLHKEIGGFVVNRLQGALLAEAFRLYAGGYMSADDIDKTIRDGLGLRWSFMGPFETIDLNAPGGISDYCARFGPMYYDMAKQMQPREWDAALVSGIEAERRLQLPASGLAARARWRDRRLTSLIAYRRRVASEE